MSACGGLEDTQPVKQETLAAKLEAHRVNGTPFSGESRHSCKKLLEISIDAFISPFSFPLSPFPFSLSPFLNSRTI